MQTPLAFVIPEAMRSGTWWSIGRRARPGRAPCNWALRPSRSIVFMYRDRPKSVATGPWLPRAALVAAWMVGGVLVAPDCGAQSLFEIPTTSSVPVAIAHDHPLAIALQVRDPPALAPGLGVQP